jgi:hypothetical protein
MTWSGLEWAVKDSAGERVGPGHNYFSGDPERNVVIDDRGRLHLRISRRPGSLGGPVQWSCSEVVSKRAFGHGTYRWQLDSPLPPHPRVVFGLFTWDDADPAEHHREIDIELMATWRDTNSVINAQFVLQPYEIQGHLHRWSMPWTGPAAAASTHAFTWEPDRIHWLSFVGHSRELPAGAKLLQEWTYRGEGIPHPGRENVRTNLWLVQPLPADSPEPEVIISRFDFEPAPRVR